MNEPRKSSGWKTFASRTAVLCLAWLLLATTFAAQFYWVGKDLPVRISWKHSFLRALVEWVPWMILSPAVVWLAERFRFDRGRRFWGVFPHVPAGLVAALAFQGIFMLLTQREGGFVFHTGSVGFVREGAGADVALNTNSSTATPSLSEVSIKYGGPIDQVAGGGGLRIGERTLS